MLWSFSGQKKSQIFYVELFVWSVIFDSVYKVNYIVNNFSGR